MHLYNAWLPPAMAEETKREKESFAAVVSSVKQSYQSDDPDSVYSTLKWISVIDLFIKAKSEVSVGDVTVLVEFGLELFHTSRNKLHAQEKWGGILVKLLNKYRKQLSLKIQWRPLYEVLVDTHFTRNTGPEGRKLRKRHFKTVTFLVRSCRRFFPPGSASEIWSEFGYLLENPWHDSSFEGAGFVRLFLPTNQDNAGFFSDEWIETCMKLWDSIPNCRFWNNQWTAITARVIKNHDSIDWDRFLPTLFTRYVNMFEVPVANGNGSYPFFVNVPKNTRWLHSSVTPFEAIAKSIVYLLKPGSSANQHFQKLVDSIEQYYHPSNGGRWTYSLKLFLRFLVNTFQKRLQHEQQSGDIERHVDLCLGRFERALFVNAVMKFIYRGQYSKYETLSEAVVAATSILSYVEPDLVLPFIQSRFHMAVETMTATHQLKAAVTSVAFCGRSLFLTALSSPSKMIDDVGDSNVYINLLIISLSNALLGMDANDPPKTVASMQLIASIFSNMSEIEDNMDQFLMKPTIQFSQWLDAFLSRLFSLLRQLEPINVLNEDFESSAISGTFLGEDDSYCNMLLILLGRLSKSLCNQALKKIYKFVKTSILPGVVPEVALLCAACVYTHPEEALVHLMEPLLSSSVYALKGTPTTCSVKPTVSPALEAAVEYQLRVIAGSILCGGPSFLPRHKDQFKEAILSAFNSPSWKVNVAGGVLLHGLLYSLLLLYPIDQYTCVSHHPAAEAVEEWISAKDYVHGKDSAGPKWHIPSDEQIKFANELLHLHFDSASDELVDTCQTKTHSDPGNQKQHLKLKVILLQICCALQGVSSRLPDFRHGIVEDPNYISFFIAGDTGLSVGTVELREKAASVIHVACKYLIEIKSDDSTLLLLLICIVDVLVDNGVSDYKQDNELESPFLVEPPVNFILSSYSKGKRRPRWALIDKAYAHYAWRSSHGSYHLHHTSGDMSPSDNVILLMDDLLNLSVHNYKTVRIRAGEALLKLMKRWRPIRSKYVLSLAETLRDPNSPEHAVLGSCSILSSLTVLKHLSLDPKSFSSFVLGILSSSHHESLKAQKAISELFVKFNEYFAGVFRITLWMSSINSDGLDFADLVSQISFISFETSKLHWRYNIMANKILLLLAMVAQSYPHSPPVILSKTAGHFLKNLSSQVPQTRILSISALNTLLKESPYKMSVEVSRDLQEHKRSSIEEAIYQEDGFFSETLNSLSHVHIISDAETSFVTLADKSIFGFSSSWPRTSGWNSILKSGTFHSNSAELFERLFQECGTPVLAKLKSALEEFANSKERSKQCVVAEAFAGILHADVTGVVEAWDSWILVQLQNVILSPSVESIPEWSACIRYAVTGKGKYGNSVPVMRQKILDCLANPLPPSATTTVVAKRLAFLSAALIEVSPPRMLVTEVQIHWKLMEELLSNMNHSSAQVRKWIGVTLSILCSNIRLHVTLGNYKPHGGDDYKIGEKSWDQYLIDRAFELVMNVQLASQSDKREAMYKDTGPGNGIVNANSQNDVNWMETLYHFIIASLKSGRSTCMVDVLVGLLYPVISLQETSNNDMSTLARDAFELLKWRIFWKPHLQKAVSVILTSAVDSNWRTRSATLTFLRTFMYRHTFILSGTEKKQIWETVEKLLTDNQVEVREHAAVVLAGLMKGGDENLAEDFCGRAYRDAIALQKKIKQRSLKSIQFIAQMHGVVLALVACVLSVPYDMPSWLPGHVTLLAQFVGEPYPINSTITKAVAEFRRTHADTWNIQKNSFTEDQLEVIADTSSSSSYFA